MNTACVVKGYKFMNWTFHFTMSIHACPHLYVYVHAHACMHACVIYLLTLAGTPIVPGMGF